MQFPRVIIAAVFFVIGALIAIPAFTRSGSSSQVEGRAAQSTTTPTGSPTTSGRSTPTTRSPSSPAQSPTRRPAPAPTPTRSTAPARPFQISIGAVRCPGRTVAVTIKNVGGQTEDYTIEQNGSARIADRLGAGASRTASLTLREDRATTVAVAWKNQAIRSLERRANCTRTSAPPANAGDELPRTGPDNAATWARAATGIAAMITGIIIFWYGGIWPRRREQIFPDKNGTS